MTEEQTIAKVLNRKALKKLPNSPVSDVRWYPYVDSMGEPALMVWVILDEETPDPASWYDLMEPIKQAIYDRLLAAGVKRFPYVRFGRQSELDQLGITD